MKLFFLRHGLAGQWGDPRYKNDSLRPLTAQGRQKMRRVSLGMQALGLEFDLILSSPYLRARQTAEIVAQTYKLKTNTIHITTHLLPPATMGAVMQEIKGLCPQKGLPASVLLVGHEPHLSEMISSLLMGEASLNIDFKKGGLCCLALMIDEKKPAAILKWLLTPAQLGLMAP